jgi:non-ribosomal peptide synthetase component F
VLVCHRSVIDFIEVFTDTFGITGDDVLGNQAPLDFDVSVKDIYSGLKTGAEVVLIPKSYFTFLKNLLELLEERRVTNLTWAVSALCLISTMEGLEFLRPEHLKRIMFSGEVMPANHLQYWKKHYPDALFVNLYGPTEITCNCTYHIIGPEDDLTAPIPIGRAFRNERVVLLDDADALVTAPGQEGELCVGGTAVTLGYYNDAERTAKAFVQNPLNTMFPEIIYRTGDLAKYGEDGLLYFAGRRDFQIKHHGRRVELGEIEAALTAAGATRACVLYMAEAERIVAYVITGDDPQIYYKALKQKLPDYMIPSDIIQTDAFPLTHNGKLDRKALTADWHTHKEGQRHG